MLFLTMLMCTLHADDQVMQKYQELKVEHLKTDTAVVNANARGERDTRMSWIWALNDPETMKTPAWMDECMSVHLCSKLSPLTIHSVSHQLSLCMGTDAQMEGREDSASMRDGLDSPLFPLPRIKVAGTCDRESFRQRLLCAATSIDVEEACLICRSWMCQNEDWPKLDNIPNHHVICRYF